MASSSRFMGQQLSRFFPQEAPAEPLVATEAQDALRDAEHPAACPLTGKLLSNVLADRLPGSGFLDGDAADVHWTVFSAVAADLGSKAKAIPFLRGDPFHAHVDGTARDRERVDCVAQDVLQVTLRESQLLPNLTVAQEAEEPMRPAVRANPEAMAWQ